MVTATLMTDMADPQLAVDVEIIRETTELVADTGIETTTEEETMAIEVVTMTEATTGLKAEKEDSQILREAIAVTITTEIELSPEATTEEMAETPMVAEIRVHPETTEKIEEVTEVTEVIEAIEKIEEASTVEVHQVMIEVADVMAALLVETKRRVEFSVRAFASTARERDIW